MSPFHDRELADTLQAQAIRHAHHRRVATPGRAPLTLEQRNTPRWQRLRAAIGDGHPTYIQPSVIADQLWRTLDGTAS